MMSRRRVQAQHFSVSSVVLHNPHSAHVHVLSWQPMAKMAVQAMWTSPWQSHPLKDSDDSSFCLWH